jgi:hypothetical protein
MSESVKDRCRYRCDRCLCFFDACADFCLPAVIVPSMAGHQILWQSPLGKPIPVADMSHHGIRCVGTIRREPSPTADVAIGGTCCGCLRRAQWRFARLLYGLNAILFDFEWPAATAVVYRVWPAGYSRECPQWAMRADSIWPWKRRKCARCGK